MPTTNEVSFDFAQIAREHGTQFRIRWFTYSGATTDYDSGGVLTQSGTDVWTSGLNQNLGGKRSSYEMMLTEQGRLLADDNKLYLPGNLDLAGTWRIGIGSPIRGEYSIIDDGINAYELNGAIQYYKVYVRALPAGSMYGE